MTRERKLETKGWTEIACEIRVTHNRAGKALAAVLIHDGAREAWIPRSQIEDPDPDALRVGDHVTLLLPEWLAHEKGLI